MAHERGKTSRTSVYNISDHLKWCPKYRRKVLNGQIEFWFKELMEMKSTEIEVEIVEMEIMPEHVHLFVQTKTVASPHWVVNN